MPKIYLPFITNKLNPAYEFFKLIKNGEQNRPNPVWNKDLAQVAYLKAKDLATKHYFGHYSTYYGWPNEMIVNSGIELPDYYPLKGNTTESIVAGTKDVQSAYNALVNSEGHNPHITGKRFFENQNQCGVGFYEDKSSRYTYYFVFMSIP